MHAISVCLCTYMQHPHLTHTRTHLPTRTHTYNKKGARQRPAGGGVGQRTRGGGGGGRRGKRGQSQAAERAGEKFVRLFGGGICMYASMASNGNRSHNSFVDYVCKDAPMATAIDVPRVDPRTLNDHTRNKHKLPHTTSPTTTITHKQPPTSPPPHTKRPPPRSPTTNNYQHHKQPPAASHLVLVPFVRQIVPIVDMPGRTLHVDPPPGA